MFLVSVSSLAIKTNGVGVADLAVFGLNMRVLVSLKAAGTVAVWEGADASADFHDAGSLVGP